MPGETVPELATRTRQNPAKCDYDTIEDPQDKAIEHDSSTKLAMKQSSKQSSR